MSETGAATRAEPQDAAFLDRLRSFVGKEAGSPLVARDPVNEAMIRHWCDAVGDRNPLYTDADVAARSVHGGIVAPPTMLQAWTMRGFVNGGPGPGAPMPRLLEVLDEAGFTSVVAVSSEQEYVRYLRPGDAITATTIVEDVSEEKRTALGSGHFVTTRIRYTDQRGDVVGTQVLGLLKFRPGDGAQRTDGTEVAQRRPRPAMNQDTEFFWQGAARGELLIQRCSSCGELRHPPGPMCPRCRSTEWDTVRASGRGEVYSFVVHHHPPIPGFEPPFVVALVGLEEGTRLVSNVVDVDPAEVTIGMPVEVTFVGVDEDLAVPVFRPRKDG
ncbi:MAG: OB-fold domain-containing protein [Actinomycetota bacterium]